MIDATDGSSQAERENNPETFEDLERQLNTAALAHKYVEGVNRHAMDRFVQLGVAENIGRVAPEELRDAVQEHETGVGFVVDRPVHDEDGNVVGYDLYRYYRDRELEHADEVAAIRNEMDELLGQTEVAVEHGKNEVMADEVAGGRADDFGEMTLDEYLNHVQTNSGDSLVTTWLHDSRNRLISGRYRVYRSKRSRRSRRQENTAAA
jgi:hypothetical protein